MTDSFAFNHTARRALRGAVSNQRASAVALALLAAASSATAAQFNLQALHEKLDTGATWSVQTVRLSGAPLASAPKLNAAIQLERERRPLGLTERLQASVTWPLAEQSALELTGTLGTGAAYGLRNQQQATLYTSALNLDWALSAAHIRYLNASVSRLSADARWYANERWTGMGGVSISHEQGKALSHVIRAGAQYTHGACTASAMLHVGQEPDETRGNDSQSLNSRAWVAGLGCQVRPNLRLELKLSQTQAERLSRRGIHAGLAFFY